MISVSCRDGRTISVPRDKTALLIIDMQRDFCCADGYGASTGGDVTPLRAIIPQIQAVLQAAREQGLLVIHTREGHLPDLSDLSQAKRLRSRNAGAEIGVKGPLGRFLVRGEHGHDFIDELQPKSNEIVIDKPGFGAFYATKLDRVLKGLGITHLIFTGVTTEVCVNSTLREAADRGYYCLVLDDCCAAYSQELHDAALKTVETEGGIFGWVSNSHALLQAMNTTQRVAV